MIFGRQWREVYFTLDDQELFRAKNLLMEHDIKYKIDHVNNNVRISMDHTGSNGAAVSRGGGIKDYYRLLVEKDNKEKAQHILNNLKNEM